MKLKGKLGYFAVAVVGMGAIGIVFWITNHPEIAIAIATVLGALAIFAVGNIWAAMLMSKGADLTIRSQESDDERDIAQMRAAIDLVKALVQRDDKEAERQRKEEGQQPKLPIPPANFLPTLTEFSEGEYEEVN